MRYSCRRRRHHHHHHAAVPVKETGTVSNNGALFLWNIRTFNG
jgi:hypothetical protein